MILLEVAQGQYLKFIEQMEQMEQQLLEVHMQPQQQEEWEFVNMEDSLTITNLQ